jgi:hypothetical protein
MDRRRAGHDRTLPYAQAGGYFSSVTVACETIANLSSRAAPLSSFRRLS